MSEIIDKNSYNSFLIQIKKEIQLSQQKAISSVNKELIYLYFNIGNIVYQKQNSFGWGAKVIDKLSLDIKNEIPQIKGFSTRNIKRMLRFYKEYSKFEFVPPLVAQISWTHNIILMEKIKDIDLRFWYMEQTIANGWSKNILSMMIESNIDKRQGKITSNFKQILPSYESDLVQQSFKDPYIFDFLTMTEPFLEKELELNLAEYSLKSMNQPIGISEYNLTEALPKEFKSSLPTIEQIEQEFRGFKDE